MKRDPAGRLGRNIDTAVAVEIRYCKGKRVCCGRNSCSRRERHCDQRAIAGRVKRALPVPEDDQLRRATSLPVETYDERLTTVTATRLLREGGVKGKARRQVVDKVAATVILQSWLDGRADQRPQSAGP